MHLLPLAARNLLRNKRRSGITLAAIAVGLAFMFWTATLVSGINSAGFDAAIRTQAGHVVLQAEGWDEDPKPTRVVGGATDLAASLQEAHPGAEVAPRIALGGLLTSPTASARVGLMGLDGAVEARVQGLDEDLISGAWLGADDREIVLGHALARTLEVEEGDKVVYLGQHGADEVASRLFRVRGTFRTGNAPVDGRVAYAHLGAAQDLLGGGDVAHRITVHLDGPAGAEEAAEAARASLGRPGLEILTWREALPDLVGILRFTAVSTDLLVLVLGLLAAFGVLNTMLMSTLERTREFGVMGALGLRPRQVARLVLLEGLVLGVVGTLAGLALGVPMCWHLVHNGLDYAAMGMGETIEAGGAVIDSLVLGSWDPVRMVVYSLAAVAFCVLAAAYPAWTISRLPPVEALRHR